MAVLQLPAELTIYTVGDLHPQWLAWAGDSAAPELMRVLDGAAVEQADGAGLQLLVSLQRTLAAAGTPLHLAAASDALRQACNALGLADWLAALPPAPKEAA